MCKVTKKTPCVSPVNGLLGIRHSTLANQRAMNQTKVHNGNSTVVTRRSLNTLSKLF